MLPNRLSDRGAFNFAVTCTMSSSPKRPCRLPPNSSVGRFECTTTAPPMVFLPNRVPCGPRRISMRSTSRKSSTLPTERAIYTPSMYKPTPGSVTGVKSVCPMPRMKICAAERLPEEGPDESKTRFGVMSPSWSEEEIWRYCNSWAVKAETATGASCSPSSRLRAVTMISSR